MQLDHIVHFINRNPKEVVDYLSEHNLKAVIGGKHEQWGTYNSLLYLKSSYIEFLAIENQAVAEHAHNPLIQQAVTDLSTYEGLGQVCFRTDDIEALKLAMIENGIQTYPIFLGERMRSDGQVIRWKMLFLQEKRDVPFPFFIQWEQDDQTRYREFASLSMIDPQLHQTEVKTIKYNVESPEAIAKEWAVIFQGEKQGTNVKIADVCIQFVNDKTYAINNRPVQVTLQPSLRNGKEFDLFGSSYQ